MKAHDLIRKKWFRITASIVLVLAILWSIAVVMINRRGAEDLRKAIAEARAAGMPLSAAELELPGSINGMPAAEQNAALHGILKEWEDLVAPRTHPRQDRPFDRTSDIFPILDRRLRDLIWRGEPGSRKLEADFTKLPKTGPYGRDAASFLAESDHRYGATLQRLRQDLDALPALRRPLPAAIHTPSNRPDHLLQGSAELTAERLAHHDPLRGVADEVQAYLRLRAEAALQTGSPGKAAEEIALSLRLAEAVASRGTGSSVYAISAPLRDLRDTLKRGIVNHLWRAEDLDRIDAALARIEIREVARRSIESEILLLPIWQEWKQDRSRFRRENHLAYYMDDFRPLELEMVESVSSFLPSGWFDWNVAALIRSTLECRKAVADSNLLLSWQRTRERVESEFFPHANAHWRHLTIIQYPLATNTLAVAAFGIGAREELRTACALERYYVTHRTYPPDLKALPEGTSIDPRYGTPFQYELRAKGGFNLYSDGPGTHLTTRSSRAYQGAWGP